MHKGQRLKESKNVGGKKSLFLKMLTALSRSRGRRGTVFQKKEPKGVGKGLSVPSVRIQANGSG